MSDDSYIFVIGAKKPIVLHPFSAKSTVFHEPDKPIMGRYGSGEASARADDVRSELHRLMERGARLHFVEKRYYLRLALATAAFIVVYLFFSIVVRDPIPLIDELLLGGLAAASVFLIGERRALASPVYIDTVMRLRRTLDGAFFQESRVVDLLEAWRDEALSLGPSAFYKAALHPVSLSSSEKDEAMALCALMSHRWRSKPIVAELYEASRRGGSLGPLLDKAKRRLGDDECALAIAYLRLIPLAMGESV